jgi:hypothetical protein
VLSVGSSKDELEEVGPIVMKCIHVVINLSLQVPPPRLILRGAIIRHYINTDYILTTINTDWFHQILIPGKTSSYVFMGLALCRGLYPLLVGYLLTMIGHPQDVPRGWLLRPPKFFCFSFFLKIFFFKKKIKIELGGYLCQVSTSN